MTGLDVLVLAASGAAIAGVLWYFFWSKGAGVRAQPEAGGVQRVEVRVKGAYDPDTVVVEAGRPVRLDFYRDETDACSEMLVFDRLGIRRLLPAFETTPIEFTPEEPGEYEFTCGMNMMRGRVIVEPPS
jgi:plastocyanin domain-containing protein